MTAIALPHLWIPRPFRSEQWFPGQRFQFGEGDFGVHPGGVVGGAAAVSIVGSDDASGGTSDPWSPSGLAIGPASADRYVVVVYNMILGSSATITSINVNGNSVTALATASNGGNTCHCIIYITDAPETTGTTCTVNLNLSASPTGQELAVFGVTGLETPGSATSAGTDASTSSTDKVTSVGSFNVSAGGVCFAGSTNINSGAGGTNIFDFGGTTPTEEYDRDASANDPCAVAYHAFAGALASATMTCTHSTNPSAAGSAQFAVASLR